MMLTSPGALRRGRSSVCRPRPEAFRRIVHQRSPRMSSMHRAICLALLASSLAMAPAAAQRTERIVNVYNWSDYIAPGVTEDFTKETGIKVRYDTFDSNDTLETKLLAAKSGYDVVVPTAYFLERQIKAGIFQKWDKPKLRNPANRGRKITQQLAKTDPANNYAVNNMWATPGIGYTVKKSRDVLGATARSTA